MLNVNVSGMALHGPLVLAPRPTATLSPVRASVKHTDPATPHGTTIVPQLAAKGLVRAVRGPGGGALSGRGIRNTRSGRKHWEVFR